MVLAAFLSASSLQKRGDLFERNKWFAMITFATNGLHKIPGYNGQLVLLRRESLEKHFAHVGLKMPPPLSPHSVGIAR